MEDTYPALDEFRRACEARDPRGVFRNEFVGEVLFGWKDRAGEAGVGSNPG
ncbi:hypothetical protein [Candidatus Palauibacter sp.]|uniref:hypothetical protein n=1 Tax=Candidatus Palauibacter sp. TaxID=3101350 RepID=UPI003B0273A9